MKKFRFSIHGFGYIFTFSLIPTLIFLLLFCLLIQLGLWQLTRADFKEKLLNAYQQQQSLTAQTFSPDRSYHLYSKIKLVGYYDNQHSFLLDNSLLAHRVGFQVFTPFILKNDSKLVLINRGWIAALSNKPRSLPKLESINGLQHLEGVITHFPEKSFILTKQAPSAHWPQLIERLKQSELESLLNKRLNSQIIVLIAGQSGALLTNTTPQLGLPAQRHFGYAIQWFALAVTLVIIWLALSIHRADSRDTTHGTD